MLLSRISLILCAFSLTACVAQTFNVRGEQYDNEHAAYARLSQVLYEEKVQFIKPLRNPIARELLIVGPTRAEVEHMVRAQNPNADPRGVNFLTETNQMAFANSQNVGEYSNIFKKVTYTLSPTPDTVSRPKDAYLLWINIGNGFNSRVIFSDKRSDKQIKVGDEIRKTGEQMNLITNWKWIEQRVRKVERR